MTDAAPTPAKSPKKAAAKPKKPAKSAEHPKYGDMIEAAILALKERTGSSRQEGGSKKNSQEVKSLSTLHKKRLL